MAFSKNYHNKTYKNHKPFDEYYTNAYEVNFIFTEIINTTQLKDKIIYLPADSDESNFVKHLKNHADEYGYKELIYTYDDFRTHKNLFDKADFVITNPPFSLFREMMIMIKEAQCRFFLIGSLGMLDKYVNIYNNKECCYVRRSVPCGYNYFETPVIMSQTNDYKAVVNYTLYATNMTLSTTTTTYKELTDDRFMTKSFEDIPHVYIKSDTNEDILTIDYMRNVPYDYDGYMLLPISCYLSKYAKYLDYYGVPDYGRLGNTFTDGKKRYIRVLCKKK